MTVAALELRRSVTELGLGWRIDCGRANRTAGRFTDHGTPFSYRMGT